MDLSPIGAAVLIAREGRRLKAYRDSVGVLTIGIGITTASGLITVTPGLTISEAQCDALFARAIKRYVDPVRKALAKPVPQEFLDACVSLAYNIGPVGFAHSSVVRLANAGNLAAAADAFLMWKKPASIVSRREGERDQAVTPYAKALPHARRGDYAPVNATSAAAAPRPVALLVTPSPVKPARAA